MKTSDKKFQSSHTIYVGNQPALKNALRILALCIVQFDQKCLLSSTLFSLGRVSWTLLISSKKNKFLQNNNTKKTLIIGTCFKLSSHLIYIGEWILKTKQSNHSFILLYFTLTHWPGLTRIGHPFLQSFLQSANMKRLRSHSDEGHDFEKFLLPCFAQLLDIVSSQFDHHVKIREEVGSL